MPNHWTGTTEERYARLDESNRRCDGNSRRCPRGAVEVLTLLPTKEWQPIPGAKLIEKRTCSRHRQQFINNPGYKLIETVRLPSPPSGWQSPHAALQVAIHKTVMYTPDRRLRITANENGSVITVERDLVFVAQFNNLAKLQEWLAEQGIDLADLIKD